MERAGASDPADAGRAEAADGGVTRGHAPVTLGHVFPLVNRRRAPARAKGRRALERKFQEQWRERTEDSQSWTRVRAPGTPESELCWARNQVARVQSEITPWRSVDGAPRVVITGPIRTNDPGPVSRRSGFPPTVMPLHLYGRPARPVYQQRAADLTSPSVFDTAGCRPRPRSPEAGHIRGESA
jgi:hypothetical protein